MNKRMIILISMLVLPLVAMADVQTRKYKIGILLWHETKHDDEALEGFRTGMELSEIPHEFDIKRAMHSEGTMNVDLVLPAGIYEVNIRAKGKEALDVWPHMEVRFNNKISMDVYVNSNNWAFYPGVIVVDYPINRFDIIYENDYYDEEKMEDRNLYIDTIVLNTL